MKKGLRLMRHSNATARRQGRWREVEMMGSEEARGCMRKVEAVVYMGGRWMRSYEEGRGMGKGENEFRQETPMPPDTGVCCDTCL